MTSLGYFLKVYLTGSVLTLCLCFIGILIEKWRYSKIQTVQERLKRIGFFYDYRNGCLVPYSDSVFNEYETEMKEGAQEWFKDIILLGVLSFIGLLVLAFNLRKSLASYFKLQRGGLGILADESVTLTDSDIVVCVDRIDWSKHEDKLN